MSFLFHQGLNIQLWTLDSLISLIPDALKSDSRRLLDHFFDRITGSNKGYGIFLFPGKKDSIKRNVPPSVGPIMQIAQ